VLIVEDSALVVGALRLLLEESGFDVASAAGVGEAVTACRASHHDAMLLDLGLPDGSGLHVLDRLRPTMQVPRVVIAVTGEDSDEVRHRCLAAGCHEVLLKPISTRELPRRLHELVAQQAS
jgi:DNA-binding response OmpR family regulator